MDRHTPLRNTIYGQTRFPIPHAWISRRDRSFVPNLCDPVGQRRRPFAVGNLREKKFRRSGGPHVDREDAVCAYCAAAALHTRLLYSHPHCALQGGANLEPNVEPDVEPPI